MLIVYLSCIFNWIAYKIRKYKGRSLNKEPRNVNKYSEMIFQVTLHPGYKKRVCGFRNINVEGDVRT
ncbi:MAG: hypothetical protein BGO48_11430 [Mucilaginibacter sp. 44-25]|nr:MAG: hypothetical protein BGO48_11430 [Mucilaginibacter sp. 44-25]